MTIPMDRGDWENDFSGTRPCIWCNREVSYQRCRDFNPVTGHVLCSIDCINKLAENGGYGECW